MSYFGSIRTGVIRKKLLKLPYLDVVCQISGGNLMVSAIQLPPLVLYMGSGDGGVNSSLLYLPMHKWMDHCNALLGRNLLRKAL